MAKISSGKDNYVFLEATGKGHFVGVTQSVVQNEIGWFGEGDDMIFIDGDTMPTINGTGTEDYFNGAWGYGGQTFANMHQGVPFIGRSRAHRGPVLPISLAHRGPDRL